MGIANRFKSFNLTGKKPRAPKPPKAQTVKNEVQIIEPEDLEEMPEFVVSPVVKKAAKKKAKEGVALVGTPKKGVAVVRTPKKAAKKKAAKKK